MPNMRRTVVFDKESAESAVGVRFSTFSAKRLRNASNPQRKLNEGLKVFHLAFIGALYDPVF